MVKVHDGMMMNVIDFCMHAFLNYRISTQKYWHEFKFDDLANFLEVAKFKSRHY